MNALEKAVMKYALYFIWLWNWVVSRHERASQGVFAFLFWQCFSIKYFSWFLWLIHRFGWSACRLGYTQVHTLQLEVFKVRRQARGKGGTKQEASSFQNQIYFLVFFLVGASSTSDSDTVSSFLDLSVFTATQSGNKTRGADPFFLPFLMATSSYSCSSKSLKG